MSDRDFSGGLAPDKEAIVAEKPDEPFWAENLLFTAYDPASDIGMWLHLGSVPTEWAMWEDRVLLCLPEGEGLLTMWAYHYTPQDEKPAGSNLAFRCIEPFRRWKVTFDGFAQPVSDADMQAGLAPDSGPRKRLIIDLDVECATPVWDAHTSAHAEGGKGEMVSQSWAKEHYEQLFRTRGTVRVGDKVYDYDGTGWRDHSRGPRGGSGGEAWGGHVISGALFPSGKAFIFSTYWRPDGKITLEGASVVDGDGAFHHAEVLAVPRLGELQMKGEHLPVHLRWDGGEAQLTLETRRSMWTSLGTQLAVGRNEADQRGVYILNFGPCEWDGETAQFYMERSDRMYDPAPKLWSDGG